MIHGLGASHLNWDRLAPRLVDLYDPYAIDLRGFGLTPPGAGGAYIGEQVATVARFIEEVCDGSAIVFGNSFGGTVGLLLAARHPHLVQRLVLFGAGLPPRSRRSVTRENVRYLGVPLIPALGEAALRRYNDTTSAEERIDFAMGAMTAHRDRIDEFTRQGLIEMRKLRDEMEWDEASYCQAARSILHMMTGGRNRFRDLIHRVVAPALIIHGMLDDTVRYESAEWLAAERPDWKLAPLLDCGHVPHMELPERSALLITDWLATTVDVATS